MYRSRKSRVLWSSSSAAARRPVRTKPQHKTFDPSRIINSQEINTASTASLWGSVQIPESELTQVADLKVSSVLKRNLERKGIKRLTPIQHLIIPLAQAGKEVVGLANTGTGKTAAFLIPIVDQLLAKPAAVLILAPTRELAMQIDHELRDLCLGTNLRSVLVIGGSSMDRQISGLKQKPHFVIGTPGRIKDLNQRGLLKLNHVQYFVLDEADRMLDMGFINDIRHLLKQKSKEAKTLFFSATLDKQVSQLLGEFSHQPEIVSVLKAETATTVSQSVFKYQSEEERFSQLCKVLRDPEYYKALIFVRTKYGADRLQRNLSREGIKAEAIHGDKRQSQRQRVLREFREGKIYFLVATDVAARGLDIKDISHVINYDPPATKEDYIHRIGRTGRAGKEGVAVTFVKG